MDKVVQNHKVVMAHEKVQNRLLLGIKGLSNERAHPPKAGKEGGKGGPPMLRAIYGYCETHVGADGLDICANFNLGGYNLSVGGRKPFCGGNCGRAHAQVPPELVKDENGRVREWRGPEPTVKAVERAQQKK